MELLNHHVDEFIALYLKHYGVVLEREEAIRKGMQLIRFVEMVDFESGDVNENEYGKNWMG